MTSAHDLHAGRLGRVGNCGFIERGSETTTRKDTVQCVCFGTPSNIAVLKIEENISAPVFTVRFRHDVTDNAIQQWQ